MSGASCQPTEFPYRRPVSKAWDSELIPFVVLPWTPCSGMFRAIFDTPVGVNHHIRADGASAVPRK